jgi:hypothetical protein
VFADDLGKIVKHLGVKPVSRYSGNCPRFELGKHGVEAFFVGHGLVPFRLIFQANRQDKRRLITG